MACWQSTANAQTFFVATTGTDQVGNGSQQQPWATIGYAIDQVSDGATIEVSAGTYNGRVRLSQQFSDPVTIRSSDPYQARLRHNGGAALTCFSCQGIVIEGFDIAHAADNVGGLVIQVQTSSASIPASDITFRNNIIHDSTDNDLLKINNAAQSIIVEGNIFYNQAGSDEHIDINSVNNIVVQDNVFLNSGAQSITSSYIVIKDSNGDSDGVLGANDIEVKRNIFLNWQGNDGQSFVRVGEDSTANFEAERVLIENNLMIGNSNTMMRSAFTVQGSKDITFRFNTVVGDLPARNFAARLLALGNNQKNTNIELSNNIWSDPTGTMGAEGFNGADVFESPIGSNDAVTINNNLYFNGSNAIPTDSSQDVMVADDANAIFADPLLPNQTNVVLPTFNGTTFGGGFDTIRGVFESLASRYGKPAQTSPVEGQASTDSVPVDDLLGTIRDDSPDIGAFEQDAKPPEPPSQGSSDFIPTWLMLLLD
ncbi:hypothetical protein N9060_01220 [Arenicella sp.]|nr:hypothetical protein [Arenicella sp.]